MSKRKTPKGPPLMSERPESEQQHYTQVLLEEIRSQVRTVIETVESVEQRLDQKIDGVHSELKQEIQITQMALKAIKDEHDKRFDKIEKKLSDHDEQFAQLNEKMGEHDKRFDRLEEKMDRVVEKVERHDTDITFLKSAISPT